MVQRRWAVLAACPLLVALAGCSGTQIENPSPSASAAASSVPASAHPSTAASSVPAPGGPGSAGPATTRPSRTPTRPPNLPGSVTNYSVTGWASPTAARPLRLGEELGQYPPARLERVDIANNTGEQPAYLRLSFRFREAMPSCRLSYVDRFVNTAGQTVKVAGNSHLDAVFSTARSASGGVPVLNQAGSRVLAGLTKYDEFEGYVNYGLGLNVATNSDQLRPVRCGHLERQVGGRPQYTVFVDVQQ